VTGKLNVENQLKITLFNMFTGKYPYFKIKPTMEKELINAYENLAKSSEQLIQLQVQRIAQLEQEVTIHKEAVERLMTLLEETIAIAKNEIDKTILPTPTLN
jgi:hypothetical protein